MSFGKLHCRICKWNQTAESKGHRAYLFMSQITWGLEFELQHCYILSLKILIYTQIWIWVRLLVGVNKHTCFVTVLFHLALPVESEYNISLVDFGTDLRVWWWWVWWLVTPYSLVNLSWGITFFRNINEHLSDFMASHPRRQFMSYNILWRVTPLKHSSDY
jgi:hypothetical protein